MHDVFVSYSREDRKRVASLVEAFISLRGWSVWWDKQVRTGSRFTGEIESALADSRCVLVVWSKHSVTSDWVRAEADEGRKRGVLVPVCLDSCQPPMPFGQTETADLSGWQRSEHAPELLALIEAIQRIMAAGTAPGTDELVEREARQRTLQSQRRLRHAAYAAALVVAVLGGGLGYLEYNEHADAERLANRLAGESDALREHVLTLTDEEQKRTWWFLLFYDKGSIQRLDNLELSILLAIEGLRVASTPRTEQALRDGLMLLPYSDWYLELDKSIRVHSSLDFSHDGRLLAAGGDQIGTLVWDYRNEKVISRIEHGEMPDGKRVHPRGSRVVDFSPTEYLLATAGVDGTARLWDALTGEELKRLGHAEPVIALQFSPDGQRLATASHDGTAKLWDAHSGKELAQLNHDGGLSWVEFSPSGNYIATASHDRSARVWSTATGKELAKFEFKEKPEGVRFGPREKTLAVFGGSLETTLWDWESGKLSWQIPVYSDGDAGVLFNPAGDRVVIGEDNGALSWWDIDRKEKLFSIDDGLLYIRAMAASPDGRRFVTVNADNTARAWDADTGAELMRMPYQQWSISVAVSPDGALMASGGLVSDSKTQRILEVTHMQPGDPISAACGRLSLNMTRNQWHNYMGEQPYRRTCPDIDEPDQP